MYNNRQQQLYNFLNRERLPSLEIFSDDIVKIIRSQDPNKAHKHDEISISMVKTCAS